METVNDCNSQLATVSMDATGPQRTLKASVWLYLVYMPTSFEHGSDTNWRPSTAIGVIWMDPSGITAYLPCCHSMIPLGHEGVVAGEYKSCQKTASDEKERGALTVGNGPIVRLFIVSICSK
jgi:hypothetical protein